MTRSRRLLRQALCGLAALGLATTGSAAVATAGVAAPQAPAALTTAGTDPAAPPTPPPAVPRVEPGDLATAPYLGWSSFSMQVYSGDGRWITADQLVAQSDAMHEKLQPFGYDHINVDAGWNDGVDEYGRPTPSTSLYPDGLQAVIDHVHDNGQKFGLYFIPGIGPEVYEADLPVWNAPGCSTGDIVKQPLTKADYWGIGWALDFDDPCTTKYIDSVGALLDEWGVDFVKFDSVTPGSGIGDLSLDARRDVAAWSDALHSRGIWFELSWALDPRYADYWKEKADGWRLDWDVECYCENEALTTWPNIARLFPKAEQWWRSTGPGGFGDLDSLNVGNGRMDGLTQDERRTATTLWAISAAPMYTGNDLTRLDAFGLGLLTNEEVIAVNQAAIPAHPVSTTGKRQVWYSLQDDGSYVVGLFNLGSTDADVTADWTDLGLTDGRHQVRDLWARKNLGRFTDGFTATDVPPHGVRLLRVTPAGGSASAVNDDVLQVGYGGDWQRNGNQEVAATSQDLAVTVVADGDEPPAPGDTDARVTRLNDDAAEISYSGSWSHSTGRGLGDHEDDVHWTEKDGDAFELTFRGTGVTYVTERDESQGEVAVFLDGEPVATVDASLPAGTPRESQQAVWSASDLADGEHTLRVEKKSGRFMLLDRIDVEQENLVTPNAIVVPDDGAEAARVELARDPGELTGIRYGDTVLERGADYTVDGSAVVLSAGFLTALPAGDTALTFGFRGDAADDVHTAQGAAWTDLTFTGTGVTWVAPTAPDQGPVHVYVDGVLAETVDTRTATRRTQQELYSVAGLRRGEHRVVVLNGSDAPMRTDGFRYTR
ncbi:X2-like carbohydrate binding domain-containing protein [Promicromonospora sp. NPDC050880]|uniref:X2-like carbohydrate binding domain-containing protein n=1 Tax=Promicromonospora sp. NPDC050880 TaxID=3364406 RepID=UPI003796ABC8